MNSIEYDSNDRNSNSENYRNDNTISNTTQLQQYCGKSTTTKIYIVYRLKMPFFSFSIRKKNEIHFYARQNCSQSLDSAMRLE